MTGKTKLVIRGDRLRRLRLAAVLSVRQVAEDAGITPNRVQQLEGGHNPGVRPETVQALARVIGCDPADITEVLEVTG